MAYDLVHYHFNPVKIGQILRQYRLERGMSIASTSRKSGLTYDTIDNIERGRVQDVKFEAVFKLCCVYAIPIEVFVQLAIKGDEIDFAHLILLYDNKDDEAIPVTEIESIPSSVPDTAVAVAEAVAATDTPAEPVRKPAESPDHVAYLHQHIDHLTRLLELAITHKEG